MTEMNDILIRDKLLIRAEYECEYCHRILFDSPWQKEHIMPKVLGGTDDFQNLAVSCPRCNLNKNQAIESVDLVTAKKTRLFNPRSDKWENHFGIVAGQLVGRTPIGRATARLLFKRTEQQLPPDLSWWPINDLKNETLYRFLNHQRARRLGNKFSDLEKAFADIPFLKKVTGEDYDLARFATYLLMAETLYTRSGVEDIRKALKIVSEAWQIKSIDPTRQAELLNVTSIVLQQLATVLVLEGKPAEAKIAQERAASAYKKRLELIGGDDVRERLRLKALQKKYLCDETIQPSKDQVHEAIEEASTGNLGALSYSVDVLVNNYHNNKEIELVLEETNNILLSIGYGQDFDYGYNVVVRRRWWILLARLGLNIDFDLLQSDLSFWKSINMHNELRELAAGLRNLPNCNDNNAITEMLILITNIYGVKK